MAAVAAVVIFIAAYLLIATDWVHRTAVALGGAGLMLLLHVTTSDAAFFSHVPGAGELEVIGVDWNVIFLLLGMMMIVSVLRTTGLFGYLAVWAAKRARGRPYRLMVLLVVITAVASALLDNVTTVLLVAPVTFEVCRRLGLQAAPYLIAEVLASNIGGTATLVGDPPNIIIASRAGLSFNDFLVHLAPLVVVLMAVFCVACRWLFRSADEPQSVPPHRSPGLVPGRVQRRLAAPVRRLGGRHHPGAHPLRPHRGTCRRGSHGRLDQVVLGGVGCRCSASMRAVARSAATASAPTSSRLAAS